MERPQQNQSTLPPVWQLIRQLAWDLAFEQASRMSLRLFGTLEPSLQGPESWSQGMKAIPAANHIEPHFYRTVL
jgi:hypothetical protein